MAGKKTKSHSSSKVSDKKAAEKESVVKELSVLLEGHGYKVRREKLKQGFGWKAVSGQCRAKGERVVFVDRKNPLDEQVLFLSNLVGELGLKLESQNADDPDPTITGPAVA